MSTDDDSQLIAGTGIAIGLGFGFAAGLALDDLGLWLPIGLLLGILIDQWSAR